MAITGETGETYPGVGATDEMIPVRLPVFASGIEIAVIIVWLAAVSLVATGGTLLELVTPLRYLATFGILALFVMNFEDLQEHLFKFWFLFLYPLWTTLSFLWSPVPSSALEMGLLQITEIIGLIYIAARISPHQTIKIVFWAYMIIFFWTAPYLPSIDAVTMPPGFAEKNMLANRMFITLVCCLYVIYSGRSHILERILAIAVLPLAFYIIFAAESATSLVLAIVAICFMTLIGTVWQAVNRVEALSSIVMIAMVILFIGGGLIAVSLLTEGPLNAFLNSLGKDTTLTGRTELWDEAIRLVRDNPIMGLGAEGFWQPWRGDAQSLLEYFYKPINSRFSFHNSYLEIAVHLGLVGVILMLIPVGYMLSRIVTNWFRKQDLAAGFFLMFAVLSLARSMTESDLYNPLNINKMLFFIGGMAFLSYRDKMMPRTAVENYLNAHGKKMPSE